MLNVFTKVSKKMSSFEKGTCVPCILVLVWLLMWLVLIPSIIILTWIVQYYIRKKNIDTQRQIVTSNTTGESVSETEIPNFTIPTNSSPTTDHFSLQRQTTLPSYDDLIRQQKIEEQSDSPPPRYDEIV